MLLDATSFALGGAFGTVVGYLLFALMTREVLTRAMPFKDCKVCGEEQKAVCDKEDECQLIAWVVDIEKDFLQGQRRILARQKGEQRGE